MTRKAQNSCEFGQGDAACLWVRHVLFHCSVLIERLSEPPLPPWTGSWLLGPETETGTQQVLNNCLWDEWMDGQTS